MQVLKKITIKIRQVTLLACCAVFLSAQTSSTREYQLKAAFLFNFTQFIEWPSGSFSSSSSPLIIGVVGKNPFGRYLEEIVSGENVNGHQLTVQYYKTPEDIRHCHILFINLTDAAKTEQVITDTKNKHILTVSDNSSFLKQGGMIRFYTKSNKIQLQINTEITKAANLVISSKLLRVAEIYIPDKK